MKVQEVILKAMSGEYKWYQAAQILGISDRQMRRWKKRYEKYGYDGLYDRRRQSPSPQRIPLEVASEVLRLYREEYFDFNVTHFHEELTGERGMDISYTWTKLLLQGAGLVKKAKKRGTYRRRRERRPLTGMLLHLDGSPHRWFESLGGEPQTLLAFLEDATTECYQAELVPQEALRPLLKLLRALVETQGTFIQLYVDRASHFVFTPKAGEPPDRSHKTQFEQILDELGIELLAAHSPQARGRGERAWRTMQGRLPQELRRAGAKTYEQANRYLKEIFVPKFNQRFRVAPTEIGTAFVKVAGISLDRVFALRYERTVNLDHTVQFKNQVLQLPKTQGIATLARRKVEVREHLEGTLEILLGKRLLASFEPAGALPTQEAA